MPRREQITSSLSTDSHHASTDAKRKAPDEDVEMASDQAGDDGSKRPKTDAPHSPSVVDDPAITADVALQSARAAAAYIPFLSPDELLPPKLPSREEMETVLLGLRKKALVEEYFGE